MSLSSRTELPPVPDQGVSWQGGRSSGWTCSNRVRFHWTRHLHAPKALVRKRCIMELIARCMIISL